MSLGISTYAYQWRTDASADRQWSLTEIFDDAVRLGLQLVQVCDWRALERMSDRELDEVRGAALDRGLALETGTKGVAPHHLLRHLEIARRLGSGLVRSMLHSPDHRPSPDEAEAELRAVTGAFEEAGVRLALETYEQVPTDTLVSIVESIDSACLGICLDPGNVIAALEHPVRTVEITAPRVLNVHVKDFAFTRNPDMVGFRLAGVPMGEGLLDYRHLLETVRPQERGINRIIEQWCPWQGDSSSTISLESDWVEHAVRYLRSTGAQDDESGELRKRR